MKFSLILLASFAVVGFAFGKTQNSQKNDDSSEEIIKCPLNMEFNRCASSCPITCGNMGQKLPCDLKCSMKCQCKPGYIMDERKRMCVKPEQCSSPICGPNQVYQDCASECQPTCQNKGIVGGCNKRCFRGCICKPNFILDKVSEKCIPVHRCPEN